MSSLSIFTTCDKRFICGPCTHLCPERRQRSMNWRTCRPHFPVS